MNHILKLNGKIKIFMRTNKELLQVFLDNQNLFKCGLCEWVRELYHNFLISEKEKFYLYNLINNNRPFFIRIKDILSCRKRTCYYWKIGDIKPRIKWLKKYLK